MIEVKPVGTPAQWRDFVEAGRPKTALLAWQELHELDVQENPLFRRAYGRGFVAYEASKPIGRIYALFDELKVSQAQRATGSLERFAGFENPDVAAALLAPALKWLESRGAQFIEGASVNDASWAKALRCKEIARLNTYRIDLTREFPVEYVPWVEKSKRRPAVKIVPWTREGAADWIPSMAKIWNEVFEKTPGFAPLSPEQLEHHFTRIQGSFRHATLLGVEVSGQRSGFAWLEPDWSEKFQKLPPVISSRLLKWGFGAQTRRAQLIAVAILPRVRYRIIAPLLFDQIYVAARKKGYRELLTRPVDTRSRSVLRALERLGAVVESETTYWGKNLVP